MHNFPDVCHWEWEKTQRNIKNLSSPNLCFFHRENIHSIFTSFAGTIQLTVSIFLHTSLQLSNEVWASLFLSRIWPTKVIRKAVLASFPGGILKKVRKNGKVNIFSSWKNSTEGTCTIIHLFPNSDHWLQGFENVQCQLERGISASLRYKLIPVFSEAIEYYLRSFIIFSPSTYCSIFENHVDSDFICLISLFSKVISCLYVSLFFDSLYRYSLISVSN